MGNRIEFIDHDGSIRECEFPTPDAKPHAIAMAPDGAFWVSLWGANKIAQVTLGGEIHEYEIPVPGAEPMAFMWAAITRFGLH